MAMVVLGMHLSRCASELQKPCAIQLHATNPQSIARIEKKKFVKSYPNKHLFQRKGKFVTMKRKRYVEWKKEAILSK